MLPGRRLARWLGQKGTAGGSVVSGPQGTTSNFDATFDGGLGSRDVDGLAKFTGSALDALGVEGASDIAGGVGTVGIRPGRRRRGRRDLSQLGALSGQSAACWVTTTASSARSAAPSAARRGGGAELRWGQHGACWATPSTVILTRSGRPALAGVALGGSGTGVGSLVSDGFDSGYAAEASDGSGYATPPAYDARCRAACV